MSELMTFSLNNKKVVTNDMKSVSEKNRGPRKA